MIQLVLHCVFVKKQLLAGSEKRHICFKVSLKQISFFIRKCRDRFLQISIFFLLRDGREQNFQCHIIEKSNPAFRTPAVFQRSECRLVRKRKLEKLTFLSDCNGEQSSTVCGKISQYLIESGFAGVFRMKIPIWRKVKRPALAEKLTCGSSCLSSCFSRIRRACSRFFKNGL